MSIRDRRLRIEIDNIIKRNLSRGYVPTANEVIGELSRYLADNNLAIPAYKFSSKSKNFSAAELGQAKTLVSQDLSILYESLVDLHELTKEQVDKFTTEKGKYDYRLSSLQSQLTSLVNKYATSGYTLGYRESFSDMENIDAGSTTADIDIVNHEATLKRLQDIPYKNFTISVSSGDLVINQNGDINEYIDESGLVWQGIIERLDQAKTVLTLDIDAKEICMINKIDLEAPLLKKCNISIYTSIDGDKWNNEYAGEITNRCTANFSTKLRYIRIIFDKTEADKFVLGKYLYYFLVDTIKLDTVNYMLESQVVSNPITVSTNINKVSVVVDEINPLSTSIQYYVATNAPIPNWIQISPLEAKNKEYPTVVAFNTVETDQRLSIQIPSGVSNDAYELKNLSVNGQRLFSIGQISGVDITNYKLYKGMEAWKVETVNINLSGPQTQSVFIQNAKVVTKSYLPILVDKPGLILNEQAFSVNTVSKYSTTIYRESGDTVVKEMIASSHPVTVYLNGNVLYKGTPTGGAVITYPFKKGVNLLEVIINIPASATASLDLNLSILSLGTRVCANSGAMEPVSLFNLRYNTNNMYDVYTLYDTGGTYMIVVKDPDLDIRYDFVYDRILSPVTQVLFKAVLKREYSSINATPRLLSYEARFI